MTERRVETLLTAPSRHWVGDGFLVRPIFGQAAFTQLVSPFLMFDWAAERDFPPSSAPRGVGPHPHRGFETVTLVYAGAVDHRDSAGHADTIGVGDVQWMTAGSGIVHEEMLGESVGRVGGTVSMAQLWVNLPARAKGTPPRYQPILAEKIPTVALEGGTLRVVAGSLGDVAGPAETHTPVVVLDGKVTAGGRIELPMPAGWTVLVAVLDGAVTIGDVRVGPETVAVLDRGAGNFAVAGGATDSRILILAGEPIAEPIAAMGPFVMNTKDELFRAVEDFRNGRMGTL
jgi:redox-sensitive bicupin YhaK (pirin superfamily)